MKKLLFLFAFIALALISCEKEPVLTLSVEQITAPANGNSTTVTVTTNNPWTVSGNDWCTVSPSSGDGGSVMVTVSVKENTTYDPRNCTLTFMSKDLTASISVAQETNYGILLPKNTFEISSEAQQISVEVKANVEYDITINADWITLSGTKALSSTTLKFDIAENTSYDGREGGITIKEKNGNNAEFVKIIQAHKGAFVISSKEYNLSCIAQTLEVKLQTNVDVEVFILGNAGNWISYVGTKALNEKALCFNVSINEDQEERDGQILVKGKNLALTDTIRISQAGFTCSTIVYTTTDNRVLVINNAYFDVVRKSNVYDQEKGEGTITFNGPLSEIKSRAFEQCDRLKSIKIKAEINRIEDYTFYFCKNLENVEIPKSVTSIGEGAFSGCKSLESIEFPKSITDIAGSAFSSCANLKTITVKATNVPTLGTYAFYEIPYDSILRVPKGCKEKYEKSNWREFFRNIVEIE